MDNKKTEKRIEYIVTVLALLFFSIVTFFSLRGCEHNTKNLVPIVKSSPLDVKKLNTIKHITNEDKDEVIVANKTIPTFTASVEEVSVITYEPKKTLKVQAVKKETAPVEKRKIVTEVMPTVALNTLLENANIDVARRLAEKEALAIKAIKEKASVAIKPKVVKVITEEAKEEEGIISDINTQNISPLAYILKGVYFKIASSRLADKSERQLHVVATALLAHQSVRIKLRGHTDNRGSKSLNQALSQKRANAVRASLIKRGIKANRIEIEGMASAEPIGSNNTKEGRLNNRRVDIAVIK